MKRGVLFLVLVSAVARADILPDDVAVCQGKSAGQACTTDDGAAGVCEETVVNRPDYSVPRPVGTPPKVKQVKMLRCVTTARARSMAPWVGFSLSFLALLAALSLRRRGGGPEGEGQELPA
ncbi:MAG: hypothetical protein U0228_34805 [Myxococcaceae bacterium]